MLRVLSTLLIALAVATPSVMATHWTLSEAGVGESYAVSTEDDAQVVGLAASDLYGVANRVVDIGRVVGDGGRFLDARMGLRLGPRANDPGFDVYGTPLAAEAAGRSDLLVPGPHHVSAWYGYWRDSNDDGRIDDVHDAMGDPTDEFVWRGIGSGDLGTSLGAYSVGGSTATPEKNTWWDRDTMLDRTGHTNTHQEWVGAYDDTYDSPLIASRYTVVVADARPALNGAFPDDLLDPNALIDVDRYDSLSPDVESMWRSAQASGEEAEDDATALRPEVDTGAIIQMVLGIYTSIDGSAAYSALGHAQTFINPPDGKEPTTHEDDYEGRALYGGVGDAAGSFNSYPGYADAFHLYVDNVARIIACAGAYARVPGTPVAQGANPACVAVEADPLAADGGAGTRASGAYLAFSGYVALWQDLNGDTHVGRRCNATDDSFDAERNTCVQPRTYSPIGNAWPHEPSSPETEGICDYADVRGGTMTVTPLDGAWENAFLVPDYRENTRPVIDGSTRALTGTESVTLRWSEACASRLLIYSRDAILFPTGESAVSLRVETRVGLAGYLDTDRGIDIVRESVRDVDHLPAAL